MNRLDRALLVVALAIVAVATALRSTPAPAPPCVIAQTPDGYVMAPIAAADRETRRLIDAMCADRGAR